MIDIYEFEHKPICQMSGWYSYKILFYNKRYVITRQHHFDGQIRKARCVSISRDPEEVVAELEKLTGVMRIVDLDKLIKRRTRNGKRQDKRKA